MSVLAFNRGGVGPCQHLNHAYGWTAADPNGAFDEAEIDIHFDLTESDEPTRVELTQDSDGVTVTSTTVALDMPPEWVEENFVEGTWRAYFLVNGYKRAWWTFQVLTPEAGAFTPGGEP